MKDFLFIGKHSSMYLLQERKSGTDKIAIPYVTFASSFLKNIFAFLENH